MPLVGTDAKSPDGTSLKIYSSVPAGHKRLAVLVHGLAEHHGRYGEMTGFLNDRGFAVFMPELRGHGYSGGKRGHLDSFDGYLEDVHTAAIMGIESTGHKKYLLFGHSMGGLTAANYAGRWPDEISGLVLSSPFIDNAEKVPWAMVKAASILSRLAPSLSIPTGLKTHFLSHDKKVVSDYVNDPLIFRTVTARWFMEIRKAQAAAVGGLKRYSGPLCVIQAGADGLASVEATKSLFAGAASEDRELQVLDGLYHENFNESGDMRILAYRTLSDWLSRHAI